MNDFDIVIAGGGPAGLSAARAAATEGMSVLVVEKNKEIGSPTRTSGGSFVHELESLGIPRHLYHPLKRCRFVSANRQAIFEGDEAITCVMDVRRVYQHLAEEAIKAGVTIWLSTIARGVLQTDSRVHGVSLETRNKSALKVSAKVVLDATGYKGDLLRGAGVSPGFERFGVGAEFDLYAPSCDENEAVLIVGSRFAPSGYAWVFPWGGHRVRVGVGVIHPDNRADPEEYLQTLIEGAASIGVDLSGAQPVEYHYGLIPSDMSENFTGDGIIGIGDAAGHASTLVGEGIRWAIKAGRMAGAVGADAIKRGNVTRESLIRFEREWLDLYGRNLRIANQINRKIALWDDHKWDEKTALLSLLTPAEFGDALQVNFSAGWALGVAWAHPRIFKYGLSKIAHKLGIRSSET